jgi:hypothetical protein
MIRETDMTGLVWGVRLFLVVVSLALFAMFFFVLWLLVRPVVTEFFRARSAGDLWLPFLPDEQGRYGPLASNRWWSLFRADSRGSSGDLAWRWTAWVLTSVGLLVGSASAVWAWTRALSRAWV